MTRSEGRTVKEFGPDPIDVQVGARLKERRIGMRLSQTELGEAIGITFQQVQKYERGMNRIAASNLFKLANFLGVPVAYFFEEVDDDEIAARKRANSRENQFSDTEDPMRTKEAIDLVYNYFRIPDEDARMNLASLVKTLARNANRSPAEPQD